LDLGRTRRVSLFTDAVGTPGRFSIAAPGGHGEGLRRTRGEVAGAQSGSSSAERITVNTGTVSVHAPSVASGDTGGVECTDR